MPVELNIHPAALAALVEGRHGSPFDVLGVHGAGDGVSVRAFRPWAREMTVVTPKKSYPMEKLHENGLFAAIIPKANPEGFRYRLSETLFDDTVVEYDDPYRFGPRTT